MSRAVLICLAVLAQLMLPAVAMRAQAIAGDLCRIDDGGGDGPSTLHDHSKKCAHCRLHGGAALPLPAAPALPIALSDIGSAAADASHVVRLAPPHARPLPRGPPAAA